MDAGNLEMVGNLRGHQYSFGTIQMDQLKMSMFSIDNVDTKTKANSLSWKLSNLVAQHDPSYSGDLDPYTIIILSQL